MSQIIWELSVPQSQIVIILGTGKGTLPRTKRLFLNVPFSHQQFCTLLQWLIGWSVSVTAVVVQGPSYRLDIASAPQTAEDDDETKQLSDAECDDEVDEQPRNGKPANTETDAGWKSEVWLDFCETLYHIINL